MKNISLLGLDLLNSISAQTSSQQQKINFLKTPPQNSNFENMQCWFSCIVALKAAVSGNFGVGAAVFGPDGNLFHYAGNNVFKPRFRSDGHAEMQVINDIESLSKIPFSMQNSTLVTTLESCPMCLARLITAQIGTVIHIADDDLGGFTRKRHYLPSAWQKLQKNIIFRKAECDVELSELALSIFLETADSANHALGEKGNKSS